MRFRVVISKWANFYFFVQNLSEWHFSNRKTYNQIWRKQFGPFSLEEDAALIRFKGIRSKYPESRSVFEYAFFIAKSPWQELQLVLSTNEVKDLQIIFSVLQKKFNILYKYDLPGLKLWKKKIERKINQKTLVEPIARLLSKLYSTRPPRKQIITYLLFSGSLTTGGGANVDDKSVSLEISRYSLKEVGHAMSVIWHELVHSVFEKEYFLSLIQPYQPYLQDKEINIREITAWLLFPAGVLSHKFFATPLGGTSYFEKFKEKTSQLFNLMKEYTNQIKPLDETYITRVISIIANDKTKKPR